MPSEELLVDLHRSIHEVDESYWDSLNSDQDLFHTHRFIQSIEEAEVEDSEFWYLLFYRNDELIATAVLSAFTVSLDIFVGGLLEKLIVGFRRWFPQFLKIKVLFSGLPISLGQHNLVIQENSNFDEIFRLLVREMSDICQSQDIRFMCAKEFLESYIEVMDKIEDHGFFRANSIPYVSMNIRWKSFDSYLSALRHNYRRPIKLTLKKRGQSQPEIEPLSFPHNDSKYARLIVGGAEVCSPEVFFDLYLQVMDRAQVKLETLNQPFFENLYDKMSKDIKVLAMVKNEQVLGAAILMVSEKTMTFLFVGLDYAKRDEYEIYFNLVYGILQLAIQLDCTQLKLGQTSYWVKQRIGGICIPEYIYFKANSWFIHSSFKALRSVIFPELNLIKPRVFRE